MLSHVPVIRVFGLVPVVLVILLVALGIAAARRRRFDRRQALRAAPPFVIPVGQPRECRSMGRFVWAIVIGLVAVAALSQTVIVRPTAAPAIVSYTDADAAWAPAPPVVQVPAVRVPEIRLPQVQPPRKKVWFKASKPTPIDPPQQWKGEIERVCVASEVDAPETKLKALQEGLMRQLNLRVAPPPWFFSSEVPVLFRIDETKTDPVKHDPDLGDYVRVRYEVEVTPSGWQELSRLERADRSGERMEEAARWLGLLTVVLGAVAAFIRLDEWSKGYYSGRLFLVAAGLVAVAGVALLRAM